MEELAEIRRPPDDFKPEARSEAASLPAFEELGILVMHFGDFALYTASCGPIAADTEVIEWGEAEAHQRLIPPRPEAFE